MEILSASEARANLFSLQEMEKLPDDDEKD